MSKKNDLVFEPKNAWEVYSSKQDRKAIDAVAKRYVEFLSECKTERLVMDYVRKRVQKAA